MNNHVSILGCGEIGETILLGAINGGLDKNQISVSAHSEKRVNYLIEKYGVDGSTDSNIAMKNTDIVILSVPYTAVDDVLKKILPDMQPNTIIVSLIAELSLNDIQAKIPNHSAVVRSMPNIGSKVGFGLTLLSFGNNILDSQINNVEAFFSLFGENIIVSDEQQYNMAPLSSSGLSYVLYMTDALIEGNAMRGISRDVSLQMMQNILSAASALLNQKNGQNIADLLHSMCSPGGTGIKRIATLDRKGVKSAFMDAISENI